MENRQLLMDVVPFQLNPKMIQESISKNNGKLLVSGILQRANTKNLNNRIYPKELLIREAQKYSDVYIKEFRATGELDHPDSAVVNLKNVSHNILEIHWDGDSLIGTIEILPTPSGNILRKLLESGIRVGISSRGLGSINTVGGLDEVQDDFEIICWDFVSTPSTPGGWMSVIAEGKQDTKYYNTNINSYLNKLIIDVLSDLK